MFILFIYLSGPRNRPDLQADGQPPEYVSQPALHQFTDHVSVWRKTLQLQKVFHWGIYLFNLELTLKLTLLIVF